jgi:hypothetical protein
MWDFESRKRLHADHEEPSATPESGSAILELDDIRDAHATTPSVLCFYFICATILHSHETCFLMARPWFSAGYL